MPRPVRGIFFCAARTGIAAAQSISSQDRSPGPSAPTRGMAKGSSASPTFGHGQHPPRWGEAPASAHQRADPPQAPSPRLRHRRHLKPGKDMQRIQPPVDNRMVGHPAPQRQIAAQELRQGGEMPEPTLDAKFALMLEHYEAMLSHYGRETGVKMARKHLGWYTRGLPGSAEFRNRVNFIDDAAAVVAALEEFYAPFLQRRAA